jgi:hypothetical protein
MPINSLVYSQTSDFRMRQPWLCQTTKEYVSIQEIQAYYYCPVQYITQQFNRSASRSRQPLWLQAQPRRYRKLKKERLNVPRSPSEPQLPREEVQNYDIRRENNNNNNRKQQCHPRETRVIASKDEIGLYCNGPVGVTSCAFIKRDPCLGPLRDSLERKK